MLSITLDAGRSFSLTAPWLMRPLFIVLRLTGGSGGRAEVSFGGFSSFAISAFAVEETIYVGDEIYELSRRLLQQELRGTR